VVRVTVEGRPTTNQTEFNIFNPKLVLDFVSYGTLADPRLPTASTATREERKRKQVIEVKEKGVEI
jgi:hypothetical protein